MILALVPSLIGAFLLGNALAWRLRAERVTGSVIGVRPRGRGSYSAIFRYTDATGRTVDASCNDYSSSLAGKQTGSTRQLMVLTDQPQLVREVNSFFLEAGGAGFFVFGFLVAWPEGPVVVGLDLVLGALLGWYAFKRKVAPGARDGANPASPVAREAAPLQRAEDILATSAAAQRAVRSQRRNTPFIMLIGLVMLAVAVYAGRSMAQLEIAGVRAPGKVIELASRSSGGRGGSAYHPVVQFTTVSGSVVRFEDSEGTSPPRYHVGDDVQVLYLANAATSNAAIDRGIGNWALPIGFGLLGAVLIALGMRQFSSARVGELPPQSMSIPAPVAFTLGTAELPMQTMPMNVASPPQAMDGVTIEPPNPRRARRIGWLVGCFLLGWSLFMASVFFPSPAHEHYKGFGPVLLMFAPAFGGMLLFWGQSIAIIAILVRVLVRATARGEARTSRAADRSEPVGPLARVLDLAITCALVMAAGACVLIAIGLVAQVLHH